MPAQADTLRLHFGKLDVLDVHGFVADAGDDELFVDHLPLLGVEGPLAAAEDGDLLVRRAEVAQIFHGELRRLGDGRDTGGLRGGRGGGCRSTLPGELLLALLRGRGDVDRDWRRWRRIHEAPGIPPRLRIGLDVVEVRHPQHRHTVSRTGRMTLAGGPPPDRPPALLAGLRSGSAGRGGRGLVRDTDAQHGTQIVPGGERRQEAEDDQQRLLPRRAAVHESPPAAAGGRIVAGRAAAGPDTPGVRDVPGVPDVPGDPGTIASPSSAVMANSVESVRSIFNSGPSLLLPTTRSSMTRKEREP